jgi:predicted ribosome quality control (RQC) complex YloA/Tae2 family protein
MDYLALKAVVESCREEFTGRHTRKFRPVGESSIYMELSGTGGLLLSADPSRPGLIPVIAVQGSEPFPKPANRGKSAQFADILEKRLGGASITDIRFPHPGERVVDIIFTHGWPAKQESSTTLVCEAMGRHSNLILVDGEGRTLGALKTVTATQSSLRPVIPGEKFSYLPVREGVPVELATAADLGSAGIFDPKDIMSGINGLSPWTARQLAALSRGSGPEQLAETLLSMLKAKGKGYLTVRGRKAFLSSFEPALLDDGDGLREYGNLSEAALAWYGHWPDQEDDSVDHDKAIRRKLDRQLARQEKLLRQLSCEEDRCRNFSEVRRKGEALLAGFASIKRGQSLVKLPDPYDPETILSIRLDPKQPPSESAQAYFEKARRMERGLVEIEGKKKEAKGNADSIIDALKALEGGDREPALTILGTGVRAHEKAEKPKAYKGPGRKFTHQGFTILVGKNSRDNEKVTFRAAGNSDLWLHTRDYAGSHVVILAEKRKVPEEVVRYAAALASDSSQAKGDPAIDVMVTERKWVRKLKGGNPGQVTVEKYRTVRPLRDGNR